MLEIFVNHDNFGTNVTFNVFLKALVMGSYNKMVNGKYLKYLFSKQSEKDLEKDLEKISKKPIIECTNKNFIKH